MGVIVMSALGMLIGGGLSIAAWFVVSSKYRPETIHNFLTDMCISCIKLGGRGARVFHHSWSGGDIAIPIIDTWVREDGCTHWSTTEHEFSFVGAVARKQSFVQAYAYFVYAHFVLNLVVAIYFLWVVTHFSQTAARFACQESISTSEAEDQCISLVKVLKAAYFILSILVIMVEMCTPCLSYPLPYFLFMLFNRRGDHRCAICKPDQRREETDPGVSIIPYQRSSFHFEDCQWFLSP